MTGFGFADPEAQKRIEQLEAERDELRAKVARVTASHREVEGCCATCGMLWPCEEWVKDREAYDAGLDG
jgi:type II secretory pathway component PulM